MKFFSRGSLFGRSSMEGSSVNSGNAGGFVASSSIAWQEAKHFLALPKRDVRPEDVANEKSVCALVRCKPDVLNRVLDTLQAKDEFFAVTLPRMRDVWAARHELLPRGVPLLTTVPSVASFSRKQSFCLLSGLWFGAFDELTAARGLMDGHHFNTFSLSLLWGTGFVSPIAAITWYLIRQSRLEVIPEDSNVIIRKFGIGDVNLADAKPLTTVTVSATVPIEETDHPLHADFANRFPGGGTLTGGNVQEEILFVIKPESLLSMLCCSAVQDREAFFIENAQQFCKYSGYGGRWKFAGDFQETRKHPSVLIGIDANRRPEDQFEDVLFLRDIRKCICGLLPYAPHTFATGNWGCGAFGGDKHLKFLQQWIASSFVGCPMHYSTFGDKELEVSINAFVAAFKDKSTVDLMRMYSIVRGADYVPRGRLLDLMRERLK